MSKASGETKIDEYTTSHRNVTGTEWPVKTVLTRDERSGRVEWIVTNVCNGAASSARTFRRLRDAREEFEAQRPTHGGKRAGAGAKPKHVGKRVVSVVLDAETAPIWDAIEGDRSAWVRGLIVADQREER